MGKAEEMNDKVPAMSTETEASKLLEQALIQMDGIISGNSGTIKSHSPDFTFPKTPSAGVRDAANSLVQLLQNNATPPSPDPHIAKALLDWLQQIIREKTSDRDKHIEFKSSHVDLVTETDLEVENLLIDGLSKKFPDHKFIAEESASKGATTVLTDAPTWIIDPVDGTMNFVHSFPHSCTSIALYVEKRAEIGIVYNPHLEQLFTARKGQGAFLNGKPIRVSDTKSLSKALVILEAAGGTPIGKFVPEIIETATWVMKSCHGTRSIGSAALNLCMVACGAVDAYYYYGLCPWDVAAGELIVREAGGLVTSTTGKPFDLFEKNILTSGSQEIIDVISSKLVELEAKLEKYSS